MSDSKKSTPLGRIRNLGIVAHIDAGKTTTTERILYYCGKEHRMGEVHDGTAVMDYLADEQERGITITSAATTLYWQDHQINLIDTPGHVDFTAEVERSLRVLDGAVVIFCGVGGVEAQSETVWHQADRYQVPRIAYINKLDRSGSGIDHVLDEMRERLDTNPLPLQIPVGREEAFRGVVDLVTMQMLSFEEATLGATVIEGAIPAEHEEEAQMARLQLLEAVADASDALAEKYLSEEPLTPEEIRDGIRTLVLTHKAVPVLCGSSLRNKGVQPLLDATVRYLPSPKDVPPMRGHDPADPDTSIDCPPSRRDPLAALAFKVVEDAHGALSFVRIYSGELKEGQRILVAKTGRKERASRIWRMHADDRKREKLVGPGQIVAVTGFKFAVTGDTLCAEDRLVELEPPRFPATVISMAIEPRTNEDRDRLSDVLAKLTREDPTFQYSTNPETGQLVISGMGELHLEVIRKRITRDYRVEANVGTPRVTYRESVRAAGRGKATYEQTLGGRGHYARVAVEIAPQSDQTEPLIDIAASELQIPKAYHEAVREGILNGCLSGPLGGYPLIHVRISVVDGRTHETDSSEMAFTAAAEEALREAIHSAGGQLEEPIMSLEVLTPEESLGSIIHDLNARNSEIVQVAERGNLRSVRARVPLAEMFGYATVIRSLSGGRATYSLEPWAFAALPRQKYAQVLGYDPEEHPVR